MIVAVFTYNHLFQTSQLGSLHVDVFVKQSKVLVEISLGHFRAVVVQRVGFTIRRVLVQVGEQYRVGIGGLDVLSRALFAVTASADFVVE